MSNQEVNRLIQISKKLLINPAHVGLVKFNENDVVLSINDSWINISKKEWKILIPYMDIVPIEHLSIVEEVEDKKFRKITF